MKAPAFILQPGLEARVGKFQAVEQITPIERYRRLKVRRRAARDQVLERQGIDLEVFAIETDRPAIRSQDLILRWPQHFSETRQSLAEVGLSLLITEVAPQEISQLGARYDFAWVEGEKGEKCPPLATRDHRSFA